jgi:alpha-glucosidase
MNEPSDFACDFPCNDPYGSAKKIGFPPPPPALRTPPRPLPGFSCAFQPSGTPCSIKKARSLEFDGTLESRTDISLIEERQSGGQELGLPGRDLLYPKYAIHNAAGVDNAAGGGISNHTVNTDLIHQNGLAMYDTHNLYGSSECLSYP